MIVCVPALCRDTADRAQFSYFSVTWEDSAAPQGHRSPVNPVSDSAHITRYLKCPYMTIFNQLKPTINPKCINKFVNISDW